VIALIDEAAKVDFEVAGRVVVLEQDAVLEGLAPALDLTLGLGIKGAPRPLQAGLLRLLGRVAGDT
jgi:hypothetical protein